MQTAYLSSFSLCSGKCTYSSGYTANTAFSDGKRITHYFRILICILGITLLNSYLQAQTQDYFQYVKDGRKGYWQVQTDPITRNTEITFYNEYGNLLYKETLKNKYLKLTPKNTYILNKQLERLTGNSLIASEIKSSDLTASTKHHFFGLAESHPERRVTVPHVGGHFSPELRYGLYPSQMRTALMLTVENPAQERVIVKLKTLSGRIAYTQATWINLFRKEIQLGNLPAGEYVLMITAKKQKRTQRFTITDDGLSKRIILAPVL